MSNKDKTANSMKDFPKIPFNELSQKRRAAELPVKSQLNPRAAGVWELARRIKMLEQTANIEDRAAEAGSTVAKTDPSSSRAWANLIDFLSHAVKDRDFSVLDEFAKAWQTWSPEASPVAADSEGKLLVAHRMLNPKRQKVSHAVISAIMQLQGKLESPDRAPSFKEIHEHLEQDEERDGAIDETELCRQLKKLGLQGRIPTEGDLKKIS